MKKEDEAADATEEVIEGKDEQGGFSFARTFTSLIMGLIVGGQAAWATANMGISTIAFFVVAIITAFLLYRKNESSRYAFGSGLYAVALFLIITPLLFYIPQVLTTETESAEAAGAFVGSLMGLVIWGFVFLLFAIVIGAVGYFIRKRG